MFLYAITSNLNDTWGTVMHNHRNITIFVSSMAPIPVHWERLTLFWTQAARPFLIGCQLHPAPQFPLPFVVALPVPVAGLENLLEDEDFRLYV